MKDDPGRRRVFAGKYIGAEGWGPNEKSTGKMRNGNGPWIFFSDKLGSVSHPYWGWAWMLASTSSAWKRWLKN